MGTHSDISGMFWLSNELAFGSFILMFTRAMREVIPPTEFLSQKSQDDIVQLVKHFRISRDHNNTIENTCCKICFQQLFPVLSIRKHSDSVPTCAPTVAHGSPTAAPKRCPFFSQYHPRLPSVNSKNAVQIQGFCEGMENNSVLWGRRQWRGARKRKTTNSEKHRKGIIGKDQGRKVQDPIPMMAKLL